ncbi:hypothetical protein ACETU7_22060 [Rhodococcus sp. 3Y1]
MTTPIRIRARSRLHSTQAKIPLEMLANSKNPQFVAVVEPGALGTEIELLVKYGN